MVGRMAEVNEQRRVSEAEVKEEGVAKERQKRQIFAADK